jgi:hypothetical protein
MTTARERELERLAYVRREQYEQQDPTVERRKLAALWRQHYPAAAVEAPSYLKPLVRVAVRQPDDSPHDPDESWTNDTYFVTLRRRGRDPVFGSSKGMIQLGIAALDGTARHDWRDFQAIKNQLAGDETEAFELYPAESRLLDPSNYYTLWCFPGVRRLKVGEEVRDVREADLALAPQRQIAMRENSTL